MDERSQLLATARLVSAPWRHASPRRWQRVKRSLMCARRTGCEARIVTAPASGNALSTPDPGHGS
jgi:hypothetical protein